MIKRFVKVSPKMTADRFGCDEDYFKRYIKDATLPVTAALTHMIVVKDSEGDNWSVDKEDVINVDADGKPIDQSNILSHA